MSLHIALLVGGDAIAKQKEADDFPGMEIETPPHLSKLAWFETSHPCPNTLVVRTYDFHQDSKSATIAPPGIPGSASKFPSLLKVGRELITNPPVETRVHPPEQRLLPSIGFDAMIAYETDFYPSTSANLITAHRT